MRGLLIIICIYHDFSISVPIYYKDAYVNSCFSRKNRLWNSLPAECFPLTYDLNTFKYDDDDDELFLWYG